MCIRCAKSHPCPRCLIAEHHVHAEAQPNPANIHVHVLGPLGIPKDSHHMSSSPLGLRSRTRSRVDSGPRLSIRPCVWSYRMYQSGSQIDYIRSSSAVRLRFTIAILYPYATDFRTIRHWETIISVVPSQPAFYSRMHTPSSSCPIYPTYSVHATLF